MARNEFDNLTLGKEVPYPRHYDPSLLCPVPRKMARTTAGIDAAGDLFYGEDLWNIYELSWLDQTGRPRVAMAEIRVPFNSPNLIESKSLKLYCNSFNMHRVENDQTLSQMITADLAACAGAPVTIKLILPEKFGHQRLSEPPGKCIDSAAADGFQYDKVDATLLKTGAQLVQETLFSRLFRSRCPVTGQPDWATLFIHYQGMRLDRGSLLQYLVSFRDHQSFHEACVEQIFCDLNRKCAPVELTVTARFTRRGGLDINPVRSNRPGPWPHHRDPRQ
jgi:7-cyano-7-deazaguanine reductase